MTYIGAPMDPQPRDNDGALFAPDRGDEQKKKTRNRERTLDELLDEIEPDVPEADLE